MRVRHLEEAIPEFRRVLELDPGDPFAATNLEVKASTPAIAQNPGVHGLKMPAGVWMYQ